MEEFEKKRSPFNKSNVICNPNDPNSVILYSREEMEILKSIIIKHKFILFADEAYREFCYGKPSF